MKSHFVSALLLSTWFGVAGLTYADTLNYTYTIIDVPGSSGLPGAWRSVSPS
jgi:hypothetical protein